jgi:hypothetical protein
MLVFERPSAYVGCCLGLFDTCPWHVTARRMAQT